MRMMWCWRCQMDLPMLDEDEFAIIEQNGWRAFEQSVEDYRQEHGLPPDTKVNMSDIFQPVRAAYERITGMAEPNLNAIMHHRISIYGLPCHACGKLLRTPQAKLCAACWTLVPRNQVTGKAE